MDATDSTWRASVLIYRILVAGQTLAILCVVGLGAGLVTYALGPRTNVGAGSQINIPIAVLIRLMMYRMMFRIDCACMAPFNP